ncbi:MAG: flagellar hook-basal body complex protein FliE [Rhodanobacter sp.]|nr:MAG: flagellar hook-basal body complex protein FliE [Rhodanobacter sp.]TAM08266.1 MAG: flagellar hook-basal body complex protein FliE [Rhodanobacter sp.]TAM37113.1 MAG: flagellar hook-basal body complex protein FliE [Rhodanobacter sp.]
MSSIDITNLLNQMHQMKVQSRFPETAVGAPAVAGNPSDFAGVFRRSLAAVGNQQMEAGQLAASFERGDPGADLARTMIAVQKADLSLRTAVAVQSKLVDAYNTIMNMSV